MRPQAKNQIAACAPRLSFRGAKRRGNPTLKQTYSFSISVQRIVAFKDVADGAGAVKLRLRLSFAHLHLLPLGLVNEELTGLGAFKGTHDAPLFHLIHQSGGAGVAQLQPPLQHGHAGLSRFQHHLHGGGQQLVPVVGAGRGLGGSGLLVLVLHRLLDLAHDVLGVGRFALFLHKVHHPLDLLGGYEIIAGHRRQMASQLAGYRNMPCIVRNMTDDEAILAMTDDNLRQRETILPSEKAMSLKMQYEAIKHQGARGDSAEAGKLSLESVGQRNGMSVKTVQRYIWLNDLVPELKQTMDDGKLSFTPAVEISRVRPKHQKYIAVSIEGQQASPSKGQAKRLRELDKENKLSPDVIDGILCEEKKKEDRDVIITGAELEKFFGKEATPRQMKDQIMALLEDWKERQPPELAKPDKKMDMEK